MVAALVLTAFGFVIEPIVVTGLVRVETRLVGLVVVPVVVVVVENVGLVRGLFCDKTDLI